MHKATLYEGRQIALLPMVFMDLSTAFCIELVYEVEGMHK
jgi:hypothetical protein